MILEAVNLKKRFNNKTIFENLNFSVAKGEIFVVTGESGCGKTTLLNIISTLDNDYDGSVNISGENLKNLSSNSLSKFRHKEIGIVFQNHNLLPEFSILENITMPLYISDIPRNLADQKAKELMSTISILDCEKKFPNEVSGGQAQRAAFARAIINNPKIIFADEPTGSLDKKNADNIHQLILDIKNKFDITFIISTHSKDLVAIADRVFEVK